MTELAYSFADLSDASKETARALHRDTALAYDWWDSVYEDAVRMAAILGIEIDTPSRQGRLGRTYRTIDIEFSGFWSQGDGARFRGRYDYRPDAVAKIKAETNDLTLIHLAERLAVLHVTERLNGAELGPISIRTASSHYAHSGSMEIEWEQTSANCYPLDEDAYLKIFQDFADWIYASLESEHDYLTSDESIDGQLAGQMFDEDGNVI